MVVILIEGLPLLVGETLIEGLALIVAVILLLMDTLTEGVILRVEDTLAVIDTLSGGVTLLEGVSLIERVTDEDINADSFMLLLAVVVLLLVIVEDGNIDSVRDGLTDFVDVRVIVDVRVGLGVGEGGIPMVPAKL